MPKSKRDYRVTCIGHRWYVVRAFNKKVVREFHLDENGPRSLVSIARATERDVQDYKNQGGEIEEIL